MDTYFRNDQTTKVIRQTEANANAIRRQWNVKLLESERGREREKKTTSGSLFIIAIATPDSILCLHRDDGMVFLCENINS